MWKRLVFFVLTCLSVQSMKTNEEVRAVHVVFSHHLDVGLDFMPNKTVSDCGVRISTITTSKYTSKHTQQGFATKIVNRYFQEHIPRAIEMAKRFRDSEKRQFVYQMHAWMLNLYVNCVSWTVDDGCPEKSVHVMCPSESEIKAFDDAVRSGDIVWTHSPFNINPELVGDPYLFEDLVQVANALDERYGMRNMTRVWSNVDVKGFSRSAIPLLKRSGFEALYVGQNGGPTAPAGAMRDKGLQPVVGTQNATIFKWIDPISKTDIPVLYHDGYGGFESSDTCLISSNGVALASYFRSDNAGPPESVGEINAIFDRIEAVFPNATTIRASSFGAFVQEVKSSFTELERSTTLDWGDQWLTGTSTDPLRLAKYRAVVRARRKCIQRGQCDRDGEMMKNMTRFLMKNVEHTQGIQGEDWSPGIAGPFQKQLADTSHWSNEQFELIHNSQYNKFFMGDFTWIENRKFNSLALNAVKENIALTNEIQKEWNALIPSTPDTSMLRRTNETVFGNVTLNPRDGSVAKLRLGNKDFESMFELTYVTYNSTTETWDGKKNLTCNETGCANPQSAVWYPSLSEIYTNCTKNIMIHSEENHRCHVFTKSEFDSHLHTKYGAPLTVFFEHVIHHNRVETTLQWFNKSTTRLPESLVLSFRPNKDNHSVWESDVLGEFVGTHEVAIFGTTNPYQRAVWSGVRLSLSQSEKNHLYIESLDAALACPIMDEDKSILGGSTPMGEGTAPQHVALNVTGMAYSLYQNLMPISGFPQWYPFGVGESYQRQDEASKFRFITKIST